MTLSDAERAADMCTITNTLQAEDMGRRLKTRRLQKIRGRCQQSAEERTEGRIAGVEGICLRDDFSAAQLVHSDKS